MTAKISKQSVIDAELARLHKQSNKLTTKAVLAAARHKSSPLHGEFEWNDGAAAEKWRLEQARQLIATSSYMLLLVARRGEPVPVAEPTPVTPGLRAFIFTGGDEFHDRKSTLSNKKLRAGFIATKKAELLGWCKSVSDISEFDAVRKCIMTKLSTLP